MFSVVYMVTRVLVAIIACVGVVRVRRVVRVRVGRVGQRRVAVSLPPGAGAVLPVRPVLAVVAAVHDSVRCLGAHGHAIRAGRPARRASSSMRATPHYTLLRQDLLVT